MSQDNKSITHINKKGNPAMVDVGDKTITRRIATARATVILTPDIIRRFDGNEFNSKKGPVFQTAILAGIMAAKKTGELIPLCHPLPIENCEISIQLKGNKAEILATASINAKTGVEMEALTAASMAALTIYDMCKAISHEIVITEIMLMKKSGGKSNYVKKF